MDQQGRLSSKAAGIARRVSLTGYRMSSRYHGAATFKSCFLCATRCICRGSANFLVFRLCSWGSAIFMACRTSRSAATEQSHPAVFVLFLKLSRYGETIRD